MKTVVITGSARGFGLEMLKLFRINDFNTVICDISKESITTAKEELEKINSKGKILSFEVDITKEEEVKDLINKVIKEVKTIDRLIDIDLKGTITCSKLIMQTMIKQKSGQIFNVEGHGSNDAKILGLSLYGTSKRAVTYFTEALAYEAEQKNTNVLIGKITPGIMITNFITTALGDGEKITLDEKTKKVYNILGDYPETIAEFMVGKIINNEKNNVKFTWLTNRKAAWRFMTSGFNKRDFFSK